VTPARRRHRARLEPFYQRPDPFDTLEAWERAEHRDLPRMTRAQLLAERAKLRLRLLYDETPPRWFLERARALDEALRAT
jgi:hypothetical protein